MRDELARVHRRRSASTSSADRGHGRRHRGEADGELGGLKDTEARARRQHRHGPRSSGRPQPAAPAVNRLPFNMAREQKEVPLGRLRAAGACRQRAGEGHAARRGRDHGRALRRRRDDAEGLSASSPAPPRCRRPPPARAGPTPWCRPRSCDFIDTLTGGVGLPGPLLARHPHRLRPLRVDHLPDASSTPASVAGAFVAQGAPIPVKQALLRADHPRHQEARA